MALVRPVTCPNLAGSMIASSPGPVRGRPALKKTTVETRLAGACVSRARESVQPNAVSKAHRCRPPGCSTPCLQRPSPLRREPPADRGRRPAAHRNPSRQRPHSAFTSSRWADAVWPPAPDSTFRKGPCPVSMPFRCPWTLDASREVDGSKTDGSGPHLPTPPCHGQDRGAARPVTGHRGASTPGACSRDSRRLEFGNPVHQGLVHRLSS